MKFPKPIISGLLVAFVLALIGCGESHETPVGKGFFLRGLSMTVELHTAKVSLYLKKDGCSIRIWTGLSAGHGGSVAVGKKVRWDGKEFYR